MIRRAAAWWRLCGLRDWPAALLMLISLHTKNSTNMSKNITIRCKNTGRTHKVPIGFNLEEVYEMLDLNMPYGPTSAKVNNKVEGLHFTFLPTKMWSSSTSPHRRACAPTRVHCSLYFTRRCATFMALRPACASKPPCRMATIAASLRVRTTVWCRKWW